MGNRDQHGDRHQPILAAYAQLEATLAAVADAQTWPLSPAETRQALLADARVRSRLEGLGLKVAAHAHHSGAVDAVGATSVGAWLAHETRMTAVEAHRLVKHAVAVDARHTSVGAALSAGGLRPDQATGRGRRRGRTPR